MTTIGIWGNVIDFWQNTLKYNIIWIKIKNKKTLEYYFQIDESMSKMAENRSIYIFFSMIIWTKFKFFYWKFVQINWTLINKTFEFFRNKYIFSICMYFMSSVKCLCRYCIVWIMLEYDSDSMKWLFELKQFLSDFLNCIPIACHVFDDCLF